MKNKSNRLVKAVIYVTSSIILMLFLLFMLTYDFTDERRYIKEDSISFEDKIKESFSKTNNLNYLKLRITPDELESYVTEAVKEYSSTDSKYIYEGTYWTIKGLSFDIRGENVKVSIHTKYTRSINYNLKISILFGVEESDTEFIIKIKSVSFGSVVVPYSIVKDTLLDKGENTVGWLIDYIVNALPVELDLEEKTITIKKSFIYSDPTNNLFIKNLGLKDEKVKIFEAYAKAFLKENKRVLEINDAFELSFSYNSFLNTMDESLKENYEKIKSKTYEYNINKDIFDILLNKRSELDNAFLEEYTLYKTEKELRSLNWLDVSYIETYVLNNLFHIKLYVYYPGLYSAIDYVFESESLSLKNIYIGKDENESIYYDAIEEKEILLDVLNHFFKVESEQLKYPFEFSKINSLSLEVKNSEEIVSEIENALINDGLYKSINFAHSTIDEAIASYYSLSESDKSLFLNDLKDYFINKIVVYNYIVYVLR